MKKEQELSFAGRTDTRKKNPNIFSCLPPQDNPFNSSSGPSCEQGKPTPCCCRGWRGAGTRRAGQGAVLHLQHLSSIRG